MFKIATRSRHPSTPYLIQHCVTPLFRCDDAYYRTAKAKSVYCRIRSHTAEAYSTLFSSSQANTAVDAARTSFEPFDVSVVDPNSTLQAFDVEFGFVDSSFRAKENHFVVVSILIPGYVAARLSIWSAEVCWCDIRGCTTGRLWLEDGNRRELIPSFTSCAPCAKGSYSVVGGALSNIGGGRQGSTVRLQIMMIGDSASSSLCIRRVKLRLASLRLGLDLVKHPQQRRVLRHPS